MPLLPAPQASEATWVPWPTPSVVAGRAVVVEARAAEHAIGQLGMARLGAGVDDRDRRPGAGETSHASGNPLRAAHHSTVVPGAVPTAVSGVVERRVVGREAQTGAVLDLDARHAPVGAQAQRPARAGRRRGAAAG